MIASTYDISQIREDAKSIKRAVINSEFSGCGLLTGELGKAFYCACHYNVDGNEDDSLFTRANESLSFSIDGLRAAPPESVASLADGFTGLAIVLSCLSRLNFLDRSFADMIIDIEENIEELISKDDKTERKNIEYDYFYGVSGIANYFLVFSEYKNKRKIVKRICDSLIAQAIVESRGIKWRDHHTFSPQPYNLGMAHGILSIICVLSKAIYRLGLSEYKPYLVKAINWYLAQENELTCISRFSFSVDDHGTGKNEKNWIAWCYGDLSASIALLHAYKATNDPLYISKAKAIIDATLLRKNRVFEISNYNEVIFDAGLCHGLAGISASYLSVFRFLNDERYREASYYWINHLLNRTAETNFDGSAGCYKIGRIMNKGYTFEPSVSLLEGAAGVGLLYCSLIDVESFREWDAIFHFDL